MYPYLHHLFSCCWQQLRLELHLRYCHKDSEGEGIVGVRGSEGDSGSEGMVRGIVGVKEK